MASHKPTVVLLYGNQRHSVEQAAEKLISGVLEGTATDLDIEAKEILRLRERMYNILSEHTGQDADKIEKDCDRNLWLEAEETVKYGLADRILQKAPEVVSD